MWVLSQDENTTNVYKYKEAIRTKIPQYVIFHISDYEERELNTNYKHKWLYIYIQIVDILWYGFLT